MPNKPLHEAGTGDIIAPGLIPKPEELTDLLVRTANAGNQKSLRWVSRIERYGVTSSLLDEVNRDIKRARLVAHLALNRTNKTFEWRYDWPEITAFPDADSIYAIFVACMITSGYAAYIRRCQADDCRKYFVGKSNKKWCSNTCGGRYRQRDMRNKAKQRQML